MVANGRRLKATKLSTVSPQRVEWLWPDRIPQGKLVIIGGDPGLGKSQLTMDVVARITTGKPWPDGNGLAALGNALVLNAEDDAADTIRPRIDAMGGDPERVWVIDGVQDTSADARHLSLHNDLAQLREGIREHQTSLVIVDPLTAYLDGADTHKDSAVRPAVTALNKLAMKTGVTVIALIHLNKAQQIDVLYRVSGSLAFISIPRVAYLLALDPKDPNAQRRVLAPLKFNIGPNPSSLVYRIGAAGVLWESEPCTLGARQLLGGDESTRAKPTKVDEARDFLLRCLKDGPQACARIQAAADQRGINEKALERARMDLGVGSRRVGGLAGAGEWQWFLPKDDNSASSLAAALDNQLLPSKDDNSNWNRERI
jgi:AAA domain